MSQDITLKRCPECGSEKLFRDPETGELVCSMCGLVIEDRALDRRPEWRALTPEEKEQRIRTGPPTSLSTYDKGLSTVIWIGSDASGKPLLPSMRRRMWRLRMWHIRARSQSSVERNLSRAMAEIDRLADMLSLPSNVHESAAVIYRRALKEDLVRGRSIAAMAAAAVYAACRLTETPRTLREVTQASTRGRKEIARCYRLLTRVLGLRMPIEDPIKVVSKIASKAGIDLKAQQKAIELLKRAEAIKHTTGKDPTGIAAAALYIASALTRRELTQKQIASAAGVTDVTLRNRVRGLQSALNLGDLKELEETK
jgi:transcription initiation factor TFIIB